MLNFFYKNVAAQAESLTAKNDKLNSDYKKLSVSLSEKEKALNNLQIEHDALKTESADFLNLKKNMKKHHISLLAKQKKQKSLRTW